MRIRKSIHKLKDNNKTFEDLRVKEIDLGDYSLTMRIKKSIYKLKDNKKTFKNLGIKTISVNNLEE